MKNSDAQIMREAASEIRVLRRQNENLTEQLNIVRVFQVALMGRPEPQPMAPDIAHYLEKRAFELEQPCNSAATPIA